MIADDALAAFVARAEEIAQHLPEDLDWDTCWAVLAYGERNHGAAWSKRLIHAWRTWSWVRSLASDGRTCQWCAGKLPPSGGRMKFCDDTCRKQAYRARQQGKQSPFELLLAAADERLIQLRQQANEARRWLERQKQIGATIPPPDLTGYGELPLPTGRCGAGCERPNGCRWTNGGVCLFSCTRGAGLPGPPPPTPRTGRTEPTRIHGPSPAPPLR